MFVTAISSSILVLLKLGESSHMTENIIFFFFFPHFNECKMA